MMECERFEILEKFFFEFFEFLGYMINCFVFGLVFECYYKVYGYFFEYRRIVVFVRYGLMDRERVEKFIVFFEVFER